MTGSIKDYTPNFEFIIPEFNISGWHDYLEENFRSIDALFYNLFGINNFKGQWKNSTVYDADDVVFIGEDTDYSGRLVKVLVQHTTASSGNFTEFFTANPSYYELFADASTAQIFAQEAKDWATKLDGPVESDLYSSKYYADIVNGLSTEITALYNIRNDIQNVNLISTEVVNVSNIKNSVQTVASMQSDINDVVAIKSDIEWIADNDTIVTNVANNSTKITTVANNISSVNTTATNITDINTVASNQTNINTNATYISAINTNASNISDIQNAYSNAQSALSSKNLAQEWATSANLVDNTDYSAKYYADLAKSEAESIDVNNLVHKTSDETITGQKTFKQSLINQKDNITKGTAPSSNTYNPVLNCTDTNNKRMGMVELGYFTDKQVKMTIGAFNGNTSSDGDGGVYLEIWNNNGTGYAKCPSSDVNGSIVTTVNKTKSSNGYYKFGNGLIIQWGQNDVSNHIVNVNLPTAFTSTNYQLSAIRKAGATATNESDPFYCRDKTTTTFQLYNPGNNAASATWIAIGY